MSHDEADIVTLAIELVNRWRVGLRWASPECVALWQKIDDYQREKTLNVNLFDEN